MTTPAAPPQGSAQKPAAPVLAPWPFPVGVFAQEIQDSYDETKTITTSTVQFPDVQIEPDGWSRGWWFDFDLDITTAIATKAADYPFCAVDTVLLKGSNVPQTFGPFGGYDWMTINKYGGYQPVGDPRNDQAYEAAGATTQHDHFTLYFPLEISAHDALGDLQNQSDNSIYRVAITMAAQATMDTNATPTLAGSMTLKVEQDSYSEPVAALALSGRPVMSAPPVPGTRQVWQQEDDSGVTAASHTTKITNGIGFAYRNIILKFEVSGARTDADYPDPIELWLGGTRLKYQGNDTWKVKMGRRFSLRTTTADSAGGPENGIRVWNWDQDVNMLPGNEARRTYLRTQDGNVLKIVGTWGAAGTLYMTSNYVIPRGGPAQNASIVA